MATIDTSNPYDDFPENLKVVLDTAAAKAAIGHALTFATIVPDPATLPIICIEFDHANYDYADPVMDTDVSCNIYYLDSLPGQAKREQDIRKALWAIFKVLHDDGNCNGYATSRLLDAVAEVATISIGPTGFDQIPEFNGGRLQVRYKKKEVH